MIANEPKRQKMVWFCLHLPRLVIFGCPKELRRGHGIAFKFWRAQEISFNFEFQRTKGQKGAGH